MRRRAFIAGVGSAAVWPLAARAQQVALPVIGYLSGGTESSDRDYIGAFRRGLGEQGYVEGRNVEILFRWAETRNDRLLALAAELVRRRVAVIVATRGHAPALAAQSATTTIPIVFNIGADPVELGLVGSLNRPGGNATGVTVLTRTLTAKRLELLSEMVPTAKSIGLLVNPTSPQVEAEMNEVEIAAHKLGVRVERTDASSPDEIEAAFATLHGVDALLTATDPLFWTQLAGLAARHRLPAIYIAREIVDAGGLMSYGPNFLDSIHLTGTYAGRILNGEKPAELPVQQSTRIELAVNLKTAKALGIEVPPAVLVRADEVIE
jgi:putative tryptophan/tyrosine transport system substrate-binding protein